MLKRDGWMGLFDVFMSEEECSVCLEKSEIEFQTKALLSCLFRCRREEIVETDKLVVKDGIVKDCLASCPKCGASLVGDVVIENYRFVKVQNLRTRKDPGNKEAV
jgi:hypothetical protein